jgi:hypothetical protein
MSRDLPEQKPPPPVALRIVDMDKDPSLPIEERIDREKTAWAHNVITDGGKKVPLLIRSAQEQMKLVIPTPLEAAEIEKLISSDARMCGACARCDYPGGQEQLRKGGAWAAYEQMGRKIDLLPPWQNLGLCEAHGFFINVTSPAVLGDGPCPEYRSRAGKFLRSLGGVIKRIKDI